MAWYWYWIGLIVALVVGGIIDSLKDRVNKWIDK